MPQKSYGFVVCWNIFEGFSTNSVDPDQTAPVGAVWAGPTLFTYVNHSTYVNQ